MHELKCQGQTALAGTTIQQYLGYKNKLITKIIKTNYTN